MIEFVSEEEAPRKSPSRAFLEELIETGRTDAWAVYPLAEGANVHTERSGLGQMAARLGVRVTVSQRTGRLLVKLMEVR